MVNFSEILVFKLLGFFAFNSYEFLVCGFCFLGLLRLLEWLTEANQTIPNKTLLSTLKMVFLFAFS